MYCEEIRQLLSERRGQVKALPESGQIHLKDCEDCAEFAEPLEFSFLFNTPPAETSTDGFTDRALQQAWQNREANDQKERSSHRRAFAIAACLVLATR